MSDKILHRGSGNVYKDLGFPDAEEMQAKAALVSRIMSIVKKKKWTQEKASIVLGVPQPKISLLSRGQFSGFSLGKLITLLNKLNQDIEIVVKNRSSSKKQHVGHVSVTYV
jgi:predicted XRE-type DNA-binding protein